MLINYVCIAVQFPGAPCFYLFHLPLSVQVEGIHTRLHT